MPSHERNIDTERRLTELETRLVFQEQAMQELSEALADARIESEHNRELLSRVLEDLKQLRFALMSDPASEPPPPHY